MMTRQYMYTFRIVFGAVGCVVVEDAVVVVLDGVGLLHEAGGAAGVALLVVLAAEEAVVAQGKLVAGHELLLAGDAPEALQVEDLVLRPHHKVVLAKRPGALLAPRPK